jgi:fucose permease
MKVDAADSQPFGKKDSTPQPEPAPSLPLMHATFILAGFGTMLLGPILPLLAAQWHLPDAQIGLLLMAQFIGATIGGVSVSQQLLRDLKAGLVAAFVGFFAFAIAPSLAWALPALLVGGFGVGRTIASVNIIAGARFTANRGAALSRLNFTWSFGALLSPLLAAWLLPHLQLRYLLLAFALGFLLCAARLLFSRESGIPQAPAEITAIEPPLAPRIFLYFGALIFLYGGIETCLAGWLTTYALRYGKASLVLSEYTMVLLLCGLTFGRGLSSWLLVRMRDMTLQRIAIAISVPFAAALALTHQATMIAVLAVVLGITLAPIFPTTFAILMAHRPPARTAGIALAMSGLGAAILPPLMGLISTRANSLQLALAGAGTRPRQ